MREIFLRQIRFNLISLSQTQMELTSRDVGQKTDHTAAKIHAANIT